MDIVSHIEDGYFLSNILGKFVDTKMFNQKGGQEVVNSSNNKRFYEMWWITWKIKCFYNWEPISQDLIDDLRAPILGQILNAMIKTGIVMVTLLCLPFVPWIAIIVCSWSLFKENVLSNIVGDIDSQTYFKVIAVIAIVLIWMFFFIN